MPTRVCLIVPCFNEARRLNIEAFANPPSGVTCLLVDDGSTDGTADLVRRHASSVLHLLQLPRNVGKAEAVRQGMLHARSNGLLKDVEWVGYWDADLATPLEDLEGFFTYAARAEGRVDAILGSRISRLGSRIVRSFRRHVFGRLFATTASTLLGLECYDSQCGAKVFRVELVERAFAEPFLSRWIFDVEVLARLQGLRIIEYPLPRWTDVRGSKINVIAMAGRTLIDLIRIRGKYARRNG